MSDDHLASAKRVGARLRELRKSKGLTQEELGRALGVSGKVIGFWETGTRRLPVKQAVRLADQFPSLSLDWLLLGKGSAPAAAYDQRIESMERKIRIVDELVVDVQLLKQEVLRVREAWGEYVSSGGKDEVERIHREVDELKKALNDERRRKMIGTRSRRGTH